MGIKTKTKQNSAKKIFKKCKLMATVQTNILSAIQNTFQSLIWPRTHQSSVSALDVLNFIPGSNQTIRKLSTQTTFFSLTRLYFIIITRLHSIIQYEAYFWNAKTPFTITCSTSLMGAQTNYF